MWKNENKIHDLDKLWIDNSTYKNTSYPSYGLGWLAKWRFIEKYFRIKIETIKNFKDKIDKWGSVIAFFCWLPIIGDPLAVGLGFFKTNVVLVSIWMFIGKMIRYIAWAGITYWGFSLI